MNRKEKIEKSEITKSLQNKRVYLTTGERFEYWANAILMLSFIVSLVFVDVKSHLENEESPYSLIFLIGMIAAIAIIWHKIKSSTFEIWNIEVSEAQFKEASLAAAIYLDWKLLNHQKSFLKALKTTHSQDVGIQITAIRTDKAIYFNSMVAPSIWSNPFSGGWNRTNKKTFKDQLLKVLNGENVVEQTIHYQQDAEKRFWEESELSTKNLFMKITGYAAAILFIVLGIWMIVLQEPTGIMNGIACICVSVYYLYIDLKIVFEKQKRRKEQNNKNNDGLGG